ncbi:amino acid--tRNA ligase-related protein, partial [Planctomycetota bacterium]
FFSGDLGVALTERTGASPGDLILLVADKNSDITAAALGELRLHMGEKLQLIDRERDEFLWVTDFPYFEYDLETESYIACRHPFTHPRAEDVASLEQDPLKVHAVAYDLVLNGVELGSGSIRVHDSELQRRVLKVLGYTEEESEERFGFLLEALTYGAPPHGGAALGLDRFAALLQGLTNLREVVAFPKTAKATCLFTGAPSAVIPHQLEELAIRLATPREESGSA